jgi:hypothetical protein
MFIDYQELAKDMKDDMEKNFTAEKEKAMEKRLRVRYKAEVRRDMSLEMQEERRKLMGDMQRRKRDMERGITEKVEGETRVVVERVLRET